MATDVPDWQLGLLRELAGDDGRTARDLGATLRGSGLPGASASGTARRALDRLRTFGFVTKQMTGRLFVYRITEAGLSFLSERS